MPHPLRRFRMFPLFLACAFAASVHADDSSTIEERMSYKEFTGYGLDKLSPEQLRGLNEWMKAHGSAACAPVATTASGPAAAPLPAKAQRTTSRLVGEFRGWQKGTVLVLANGQRWEVRDDEPFVGVREDAPEVTVEPGLLNGWQLSVAGHNEVAHVIPAGQ